MKSFLLLLLVLAFTSARAEVLTYPDLVRHLTDLDLLALHPRPGEKTALASSYDRHRQYDAVHDRYIDWGADGDGGGFVRMEGPEKIMADLKGPGVIWRTWSASPNHGHVKIYLDGSSTPAVDLPFIAYFDGSSPPFNRPHLDYLAVSNGYDNYTPIPFQKSCKIAADPGWGAYGNGGFFQFTYTTFPAGTVVPTFHLPLSAADNAALDEADKILGAAGNDPAGTRPGQETTTVQLIAPPHQGAPVADFHGSGVITALKVKFDPSIDLAVEKDLLRQLVIRIRWDHEKTPAVWAPFGDFFGDAIMPVKYQSLPAGITQDGTWYSYWYMPYASGAHLSVQNDAGRAVKMTWEITRAPLTQPAGSLLRFHAKWHRDAFLPQRKDRWPDWTLLTTTGAGRYVGTRLHVWNPRWGWWGEGNDKFFVDGEKFPSTLGTGSEDYFGFAWSSGTIFSRPFHGQPACYDHHASLYRWHIPDSVPFQKSFEADIEKYQPNDRPMLYDAVAYWYLAPGGSDPYGPVPVSDRVGYMTPPVVYREPGAIEAEFLDPIHSPWFERQEMWIFGPHWSGAMQLLFHGRKPGDRGDAGEFAVKAPAAGTYRLLARFSHAPDYGIVQVRINSVKMGAPLDLYAAKLAPVDPADLGTAHFNQGANTLTLQLTGKNPNSTGYDVGLDYIKLIPVPL